jgi:uncharacterized membrane protein YvbJ
MYCTNCGKAIESKNSFCSYCGDKILIEMQASNISSKSGEQNNSVENFKKIANYEANNYSYLIIGLIIFIIYVFWNFIDYLHSTSDDSEKLIEKIRPFLAVVSIIQSFIVTLLCCVYASKKAHKIILLILAVIMLCWSINENIYNITRAFNK